MKNHTAEYSLGLKLYLSLLLIAPIGHLKLEDELFPLHWWGKVNVNFICYIKSESGKIAKDDQSAPVSGTERS